MFLILRRNKYSFTFIEMLIVLVIFSIIGLVVFTSLSNGINIWQRLNIMSKQEDVNIFFERFISELRNTFEFNAIRFLGEKDKISFACLVPIRSIDKGQGLSVGQVVYRYDKRTRSLIREDKNYSQIYSGGDGYETTLLDDVLSLKLSYYFFDDLAREYFWQEEWQAEDFPLAVRIELEFGNKRVKERAIRTVSLPVSQY